MGPAAGGNTPTNESGMTCTAVAGKVSATTAAQTCAASEPALSPAMISSDSWAARPPFRCCSLTQSSTACVFFCPACTTEDPSTS
eukprot:scaffold48_cov311-Pinguiococcus_pyrenoidosus.AAC.141